MDKDFLERALAKGLSLEQIGERAGRRASTVGYWVARHGLVAVNRDRHARRGGIDAATLAGLIEEGLSLRAIAERLGVAPATVRHWVKKHNLATARMVRDAAAREARAAGLQAPELPCPVHGPTTFRMQPSGRYRCIRCASEAVAARRRRVKLQLVAEAGGACLVCGYDRYPGALHFHHVDPEEKRFALSREGVTRSLEAARDEARKCVLLCGNCHAEVEAGLVTLVGPGGKVDRRSGASGVAIAI